MLIQTKLRFERRADVGMQGANSKVFFAFDPQLSAELVVKEIQKTAIADPAAYFDEAAMLYATRHPNVVDVKYSCEDDQRIYLAMPRYAGSLHGLLQVRALTVREIVKLGLELATGLHHVHTKKLVHFDVKPSNVLLDEGGRAAVADFGLSRPVDVHGLATPKELYGKHVPPEYIGTSTALSSAADVYQAGLTLYRMCVGLANFDWQLSEILKVWGTKWSDAVIAGKFPNRQHYPAHIPSRLRALIQKALAVNPASRFASILEMANELGKVDEHLDWQFEVTSTGASWKLDSAGYVQRVLVKPDGTLQGVVVTRENKSSGKTSTLHTLCASGLSSKAAADKVRLALTKLEGTP